MKKATIRTPVEKLKGKETIEHYNAALLEDIKSKMELVVEGMESTKATLKKEVVEFRDEVNQRFDMIENVVRGHSGQLQNIEKQLAGHGKQLADHGKQLADHGKQLAEINKHLTDHDGRFQNIETKVDKIGGRLDDHETRIVNLETVRL